MSIFLFPIIRAGGLPVQNIPRSGVGEQLHLIVDSTGLKLRGAGEWLFEKHGTSKRRSWRKLHVGIDADNGQIVAFDLTDKEIDDASHVSSHCWSNWTMRQLRSWATEHTIEPMFSTPFPSENPDTRFIVPPCKAAMLGSTATTFPTQRDLHIRSINEHGPMYWQKISGYNRRSKVEAAIGRYKRVMGDALRPREDARREVKIAVKVLNRMLELGRPVCVRVA